MKKRKGGVGIRLATITEQSRKSATCKVNDLLKKRIACRQKGRLDESGRQPRAESERGGAEERIQDLDFLVGREV